MEEASGGRDPDALESIARIEEWKSRLAASVSPDPRRLAEGWTFRFLADGERAVETASLYRELGFRVLLDPVQSDHMAEGCKGCILVDALRFQMVYTRKG